MNDQKHFYQRQITLSEVGEAGQERLSLSKVLVIGAGGLGCPVLEYLTASGIGSITICDFDKVDYTNLHRQVLFTPEHVGQYKAKVAASRLRKQNPHIIVEADLSEFNLDYDISFYDLVLDCSDNFKTKFIAHDLCYQNDLPLIQGSIHKFEGQIQVFNFGKRERHIPCLRCLWPETPESSCVQSCSEAGVLGVVPGIIGSMQASEAIKYFLGMPTLNAGETLIVNLLQLTTQKIKWKRSNDCPLCQQDNIELSRFTYDQSELEIEFFDLDKEEFVFVNLTGSVQDSIKNSIDSSLDRLLQDTEHLGSSTNIVLFCNRGITSLKGVKIMKENGFPNCLSLKNGIQRT